MFTILYCMSYNTYDNKYLQHNIIFTRIWLNDQVFGGEWRLIVVSEYVVGSEFNEHIIGGVFSSMVSKGVSLEQLASVG